MRWKGGLTLAVLLTLTGASEAQAQYWRQPPRAGYWQARTPMPPRAYVVSHYDAYRDYPQTPLPPPRTYRPRYRCDRGSGGTILGAIAGGLLGNRAAGRGNRDIGTVAGALIGREVDRGC